ncbi:MAG: hypothetical protein V2A72_02000 [Candidatus Omnitrophota bacterium]
MRKILSTTIALLFTSTQILNSTPYFNQKQYNASALRPASFRIFRIVEGGLPKKDFNLTDIFNSNFISSFKITPELEVEISSMYSPHEGFRMEIPPQEGVNPNLELFRALVLVIGKAISDMQYPCAKFNLEIAPSGEGIRYVRKTNFETDEIILQKDGTLIFRKSKDRTYSEKDEYNERLFSRDEFIFGKDKAEISECIGAIDFPKEQHKKDGYYSSSKGVVIKGPNPIRGFGLVVYDAGNDRGVCVKAYVTKEFYEKYENAELGHSLTNKPSMFILEPAAGKTKALYPISPDIMASVENVSYSELFEKLGKIMQEKGYHLYIYNDYKNKTSGHLTRNKSDSERKLGGADRNYFVVTLSSGEEIKFEASYRKLTDGTDTDMKHNITFGKDKTIVTSSYEDKDKQESAGESSFRERATFTYFGPCPLINFALDKSGMIYAIVAKDFFNGCNRQTEFSKLEVEYKIQPPITLVSEDDIETISKLSLVQGNSKIDKSMDMFKLKVQSSDSIFAGFNMAA